MKRWQTPQGKSEASPCRAPGPDFSARGAGRSCSAPSRCLRLALSSLGVNVLDLASTGLQRVTLYPADVLKLGYLDTASDWLPILWIHIISQWLSAGAAPYRPLERLLGCGAHPRPFYGQPSNQLLMVVSGSQCLCYLCCQ